MNTCFVISSETSGGTRTTRRPGTGQAREPMCSESLQEACTDTGAWHLSCKPPGTKRLAFIEVQAGKGHGGP